MTTRLGKQAYACLALNTVAVSRRLADELGVPLMTLMGPLTQLRVFGTLTAYASSDVDLLVRRRDASRVRQRLDARGLVKPEDGKTSSRASRSAVFDHEGVIVDLHWELDIAGVAGLFSERLERALWEGARRNQHGLYEPRIEPFLVFLAVQTTRLELQRDNWMGMLARAAELVGDWEEVWRVARACHSERIVRRVLAEARTSPRGTGHQAEAGNWSVRGRASLVRVRGEAAVALGRFAKPTIAHHHFAGLDLVVPETVFRPRPVTEGLVRLACDAVGSEVAPQVIDLGTGSGAVALAIGSRLPHAQVYGVDVSAAAIAAARANARRLRIANVRFRLGQLLDPVRHVRPNAITSNLPYVPLGVLNHRDIESRHFFGGGFDGLDLLRRLAEEGRRTLLPGGWLVMQLMDVQWDEFAEELATAGYRPEPPERREGRAVSVRAQLVDNPR